MTGGAQVCGTVEHEQSNSELELQKGWVFACTLPCYLKKVITIISLPSVILAGHNREQKTCLCCCVCRNQTCIAFSGGRVSAYYHEQGSGWWPPLEHFPCRSKRNALEWLKDYLLENVSECLAILTAKGPTFLIFFPGHAGRSRTLNQQENLEL